ncbi:WXG100 family type VII secretion target [Fontibacillus sp. BL9]|uniref:WXG100 family type VII secretion target n=1 Tax=Fontibacillus sp. BL9 TaxID=3389971 RepID=UPI00397934E1
MSVPSEIKYKASRVYEVKSDLSREQTQCQGQVENSSTWWQGEAGKSFRTGYKEFRPEINALLKKMDTLSSLLNKLAGKVQQADDKRKAEAEAAARAAAEAMKKPAKPIRY